MGIFRKTRVVIDSGVTTTIDVIADVTVGAHRETSETRLSSVLAALAGFVGAAAFIHSTGYFVTFMTGNTERAVLGYFHGDPFMAVAALILISVFILGVVVASLCRRHLWKNHPNGATNLTTLALLIATLTDISSSGTFNTTLGIVPISFVSFAMGALNTSFVKNGEVSVPLSYVTGTVVKLGQGIERHISGGTRSEWSGYAILYASFIAGGAAGGVVGLLIGGGWMLLAAAMVAGAASIYTYRRDIAAAE